MSSSNPIEISLRTRPRSYASRHKSAPKVLVHRRDLPATNWHAIGLPIQMKSSASNNMVTYSVEEHMHYLLKMTMTAQMPSFKVKSEHRDRVEICMADNIGHHMIEKASMRLGKISVHMDAGALDVNSQYHMKHGFADSYAKSIGNRPSLSTWTNHIQSEPIDIPQPWHFTDRQSTGLPLHAIGSTRVDFVYRLARPTSLIRMRIKNATPASRTGGSSRSSGHRVETKDKSSELKTLSLENGHDSRSDDDEWTDVSPSSHLDYLEDPPKEWKNIPTMWATYDVTEDEVGWWRGCSSTVRNVPVREYIPYSSASDIPLGAKAVIDIDTSLPIVALYFVAEATIDQAKNKKAQYIYKGEDVCDHYTITAGDTKHADEIPCRLSGFSSAFDHAPAPPTPGYHCIPFTYTLSSDEIGSSLNAGSRKIKLIVQLKPYEAFGHNRIDPSTRFFVKSWALVSHDMEMRRGSDGMWDVALDPVSTGDEGAAESKRS